MTNLRLPYAGRNVSDTLPGLADPAMLRLMDAFTRALLRQRQLRHDDAMTALEGRPTRQPWRRPA